MLEIQIPGDRVPRLKHLVVDYNGTLAFDGRPPRGVAEALRALATDLDIHVLTADTFSWARAELAELPCRVLILGPDTQDQAKEAYLRALGPEQCVSPSATGAMIASCLPRRR
jgi:soluble P-type ATPase